MYAAFQRVAESAHVTTKLLRGGVFWSEDAKILQTWVLCSFLEASPWQRSDDLMNAVDTECHDSSQVAHWFHLVPGFS